MRKFLIAFLALAVIAPLALHSQNVMTVHLKTGQVVDLAFKSEPVITFTETEAVLTTTVMGRPVVVKYPLEYLTKFTFSTKDITDPVVPTDIKTEEARDAQFLIEDYTVTITGAKAEIPVRLIASDGRQLKDYKTDKDGSVSFSIAELPDGTYIINSQDITFKILKK